MAEELHDGFGRGITYLRIAVTDKCNFRCVYCMPEEGVPARAHDELLSAEEIARFVRIAAAEGVRCVRLTGGEPLVSHRIVPLIRDIRAIPQIEDISLTTNGALLPRMAAELKDAGLDRVNISLDTLDPAQFSAITRLGRLEQTLAGIDAALAYGFEPVKVNCVVVRRLEQDVFGLAKLSLERPVHVRFIEYMPIGNEKTGTDRAHDVAEDLAPTRIARAALMRPCGMRATPSPLQSCATASRARPRQPAWARSRRLPRAAAPPEQDRRRTGASPAPRAPLALSRPCPITFAARATACA